MIRMTLGSFWEENCGVRLNFLSVRSLKMNQVNQAPIPCYVMQGEHPLPDKVIEQFSKASGELCNNVFLLSGITLLVFVLLRLLIY